MNILSDKSIKCAAIFLLFVSAALAAANTVVRMTSDFGFEYANENGMGPQRHINIAAWGAAGVFDYAVASRVGGVILQGIAQPAAGAQSSTKISYDHSKEDGKRFRITVGTDEAAINIPDWAMVPLIHFVASPDTAAMTLLGEPKTETERSLDRIDDVKFIEIHPTLQDTIVGNNFIFTDAMLVDAEPNRIRRVTEHLNQSVPGYTDLGVFDETKSHKAATAIREELSLRGGLGKWDTYIFTDVGVDYTYSVRNGQLGVKGEPYYAFLLLNEESRTVTVDTEGTEFLKGSSLLYELNPKIYMLDRELFQIAAVLRHIKASDKDSWDQLLTRIATVVPEPSMATPRAWRPEFRGQGR